MNVIFLGPPGAGKGTIAKEIKDLANVIHLSTGDMLREEMRNGTELGKMAKQYIEEGKLVPDEVIIGMVESKLKSSDKGILHDIDANGEIQEKVDKIKAIFDNVQ